ncbi:C40 family peptidase [Shewanella cyperi]|uniref:C40 family peptidase n=1 Tax=Shewanella cyperi TaxID=2814292 RepID=UPI002B1BE3BF|nr:C40 family peptidase [Shewanella cyperi]
MTLLRTLCVLLLLALGGCSSAPEPQTPAPEPARAAPGIPRDSLLALYREWQGTPYRLGGSDRRGMDCSALIQLAYQSTQALALPRTVAEQARLGWPVPLDEVVPGDLLFFKTGRRQQHVAIALGERRFLHVSTSQGVIISTLDNPFWATALLQARRLL